jgi:hypothetical protein
MTYATYPIPTKVKPLCCWQYKAAFCPACDEPITDKAETERVMREMRAFNKQINESPVDPSLTVDAGKK